MKIHKFLDKTVAFYHFVVDIVYGFLDPRVDIS